MAQATVQKGLAIIAGAFLVRRLVRSRFSEDDLQNLIRRNNLAKEIEAQKRIKAKEKGRNGNKGSDAKKKLQQKNKPEIIPAEFVKLYRPLELWRFVPLRTTDDDYIHFFYSQPLSHRDYKAVVKIPNLKQHPKYQVILRQHNLHSIPSNKPAGTEILTFSRAAAHGEELDDNSLIKKANKLIDLEKKLKNGEKLKAAEWSPVTKEEIHKDAKVNALLANIPK